MLTSPKHNSPRAPQFAQTAASQLPSTSQIQSFCAQAALFCLPLPAIKYTETSLTLADLFLIPAILLNFGHAMKLHAFQIPFLLALAHQFAVAHAGSGWLTDPGLSDGLSVGFSGSVRLVRVRESVAAADRLPVTDCQRLELSGGDRPIHRLHADAADSENHRLQGQQPRGRVGVAMQLADDGVDPLLPVAAAHPASVAADFDVAALAGWHRQYCVEVGDHDRARIAVLLLLART